MEGMAVSDEKKDKFATSLVEKVLIAALLGSFGWIIKIESHMTRVDADIEDIEDEVADLEAIAKEVRGNRIDLTTVQGIVRSIEDKVDDVKRALERLGPR
jgi:hypothetical protein